MLLQELGVALQRGLLVRAHIVLVVIEVDVFHILREEFFFGGVGSGFWRRGRSVDSDASGGILGSTGALRDEMVGSRFGGSNLTRPAYIHGPNSVDADVGRIRGLPGQRGGLALIESVRIRRQRSCRRRR